MEETIVGSEINRDGRSYRVESFSKSGSGMSCRVEGCSGIYFCQVYEDDGNISTRLGVGGTREGAREVESGLRELLFTCNQK